MAGIFKSQRSFTVTGGLSLQVRIAEETERERVVQVVEGGAL